MQRIWQSENIKGKKCNILIIDQFFIKMQHFIDGIGFLFLLFMHFQCPHDIIDIKERSKKAPPCKPST